MVDAQATFERKAAATAGGQGAARRSTSAPDFPLVLPQARTRNGVGQTTKDLTEHPWAGVDVMMTLVARDEGEQRRPFRAARDAAAGAAVRQAAGARADRAAPRARARRRRQGPRADRARRAVDRAGALHRRRPASISGCARSTGSSTRAKNDDGAARRGGAAVGDGGDDRGRQRLRGREGAARGAGCAAPGAGARRHRRRDQEADGPASRRARQVPAGAGRGDAQEPADGAAARSATRCATCARRICAACSTAWSGWRAPAPRTPRGSCSSSSSRCWRTCRWRGPAASRARTATTCSRRSTSSAT